MNREIKFRAWETNKGLGSKMSMPFTLTDLHNKGLGVFGDTYIFMQFTGLYDKHNNPIFEGDIVKGIKEDNYFTSDKPEDFITEVVLQFNTNISYYSSRGADGCTYFSDLEIIGNKFENPELLKKVNL